MNSDISTDRNYHASKPADASVDSCGILGKIDLTSEGLQLLATGMDNRCGKQRYPSKKLANKARKKSMKAQPGLQLSVYRCEECRGYHLSKQVYRIGG